MQTAQTLEPVNQQLQWQVEALQAWKPVNLQLEHTGDEKEREMENSGDGEKGKNSRNKQQ
jgi:hypothetical protein